MNGSAGNQIGVALFHRNLIHTFGHTLLFRQAPLHQLGKFFLIHLFIKAQKQFRVFPGCNNDPHFRLSVLAVEIPFGKLPVRMALHWQPDPTVQQLYQHVPFGAVSENFPRILF